MAAISASRPAAVNYVQFRVTMPRSVVAPPRSRSRALTDLELEFALTERELEMALATLELAPVCCSRRLCTALAAGVTRRGPLRQASSCCCAAALRRRIAVLIFSWWSK